MYPTAIVVLVETQRSIADVCEISPLNTSRLVRPMASEARPATLGHLSLTVRPPHSMTDNEAESQLSRALQSHAGREYGRMRSLSK